MLNGAFYAEVQVFLGAWALTQPRLLAMCGMLPLFNRQLLPGLLRYGICAGLGLVLVPMVMPRYAELDLGTVELLLLIVKEVFIGLVLGFLAANPCVAKASRCCSVPLRLASSLFVPRR